MTASHGIAAESGSPALENRAMMMRFCSLGANCEFGAAQRAYSAEPLDLFRWTGTNPGVMVTLLKQRFRDIGDRKQLRLLDGHEYILHHTGYGFVWHTWIKRSESDTETVLAKESQRIARMAEICIEYLEEGERIFVIKEKRGDIPRSIAEAISAEMRNFGPGTLLYVTQGSDGISVEREGPFLLHGTLPKFGQNENILASVPAADWLTLCRKASELVPPAGSVRGTPDAREAVQPLGALHLTPQAQRLLIDAISRFGHRYLEFGMGGATILAAQAGRDVVAVNSSAALVKRVGEHPDVADSIKGGRVSLLHADIGPVAEWGFPADQCRAGAWPDYIRLPWTEWERRGERPDLIFVDGRFRLACCLSAIAALAGSLSPDDMPRVLLQDFDVTRPYYQPVLDFFEPETTEGSLYLLRLRRGYSQLGAFVQMLSAMSDPR
jgi:hypothetical protein